MEILDFLHIDQRSIGFCRIGTFQNIRNILRNTIKGNRIALGTETGGLGVNGPIVIATTLFSRSVRTVRTTIEFIAFAGIGIIDGEN
jgi:hypothetical protein